MNRKDFDGVLSEELRRMSDPTDPTPHPDIEELAVYLDGRAAPEAVEGIESHLAACQSCRHLAMESALADSEMPEVASRPRGGFWAWRPAIGLAAALVMVVGLLVWQTFTPSAATRLEAAGVSEAAMVAAGDDIVRLAADALDGQWPAVAGFELFVADGRPVMRGATGALAPLPTAPRWSIVGGERPQLVWRMEHPAEAFEILIVDEDEELVARFEAPGGVGEIVVSYPVDAAPIVSGRAYAWKVNAAIRGEWVASPYVPFRGADAAEQARLVERLERVAGSPLLRAVVLASEGRYRAALADAASLAEPQRERLLTSILKQQHFTTDELGGELEAWGHSPAP